MTSESATLRSGVPSALSTTGSARFLETWRFGAAVVTALVVILWLPRMLGPIDLRYDAGVYYVLGTSLSQGEGYHIASEPGAPVGIQYPPALPALIAAHQLLLGTVDPEVVAPWLRRTYAVMFLAMALAALTLGRFFGGPWVGLVAIVLCLLQANTFLLSDMLFTELPFTLISLGLAWWIVTDRFPDRPWLREGLGFVLAFTAFMLRTAGLALLVAWVVDALARRRWRLAVVRLLLSAVPFLLWHGHVMRVQASDEYKNPAYEYQRASYQYYNVSYAENLALIDPFVPELGKITPTALGRRIIANLRAVPKTLGEVVSEHAGFWSAALYVVLGVKPPVGTPLPGIVYLPLSLLAGLTIVGGYVFVRTRAWFIITLAVVSVGLVLATPWPSQFPRYLVPLCPFFTLAAVLGAVWVGRQLIEHTRGVGRMIGMTVLGGLFVATGLVQVFSVRNSYIVRHFSAPVGADAGKLFTPKWFYHDQTWTDWAKAVDWIERNTPNEAIIATVAPHYAYLKTGRLAVMPPMEVDPARARLLMQNVPVSYVIIDELAFADISRRYALPAVASDPGWRRVYHENQTSIYERVGARSMARYNG
jgi:hypothetical protein